MNAIPYLCQVMATPIQGGSTPAYPLAGHALIRWATLPATPLSTAPALLHSRSKGMIHARARLSAGSGWGRSGRWLYI